MSPTAFVHIPVDTLEILDGPGYGALRRAEVDHSERVTITLHLKSAASTTTFRRKLELFNVRLGHESAENSVKELIASIMGEASPKRDLATFNGLLGDWFFFGRYNFQTRKGVLEYVSWSDYTFDDGSM